MKNPNRSSLSTLLGSNHSSENRQADSRRRRLCHSDGKRQLKIEQLEVRAMLASNGIVSDDFSSSTLGSVWTVTDPLDDAGIRMTGTQLEVSLPAGTSHDLWSNNRNAVRVLQDLQGANFEIEAKFDSQVTEEFQIQGLLAQMDEDDFVRWEVHFDSSTATPTLFVGSLTNGIGGNITSQSLNVVGSVWLRMSQIVDTWTFSYSLDGNTFDFFTSLTHSLDVSQVGLHVANHATPESDSPAFTALIDEFISTDPLQNLPVIDVWYGDSQTFGALGQPQTWINVLGNVMDESGIQSLTYSLNDDTPVPLRFVASGHRRLLNDGDFNVEIAFADLNEGRNTVDLTVTANDGHVVVKTVGIDYPGQNVWPTTYAIDWSKVTNLQDVGKRPPAPWGGWACGAEARGPANRWPV